MSQKLLLTACEQAERSEPSVRAAALMHIARVVACSDQDAKGDIVSETKYSDWRQYSQIFYPSLIQIRRPLDGDEVTMTLIDMKMNTPEVTADKFVLEQPAGSTLERLK